MLPSAARPLRSRRTGPGFEVPPVLEELESKAKAQGLWNLLLSDRAYGAGVPDPRAKIFVVMGKTDPDGPRHAQQSQVLVARDTPGVKIGRHPSVFGYHQEPHGHSWRPRRRPTAPAPRW